MHDASPVCPHTKLLPGRISFHFHGYNVRGSSDSANRSQLMLQPQSRFPVLGLAQHLNHGGANL
jgi:hypothetical protein